MANRRRYGLFLSLVASACAFNLPPDAFRDPPSEAVDHVNTMIGNGGDSPNGSGGMIPSTAPPFAMTRWVAQTRQNYVSVTPYNVTGTHIYGFQATHQPTIWMGESGSTVVVPGAGRVATSFEARGMPFKKETEVHSPSYYSVELQTAQNGVILAEQSATSRVGHLRFTFTNTSTPHVLLELTRASVLGSAGPSNVTYPAGSVLLDPSSREICGSNPERQDAIIGPNAARSFAGYFCARFNTSFAAFGTLQNGTLRAGERARNGTLLSGYAVFAENTSVVDVRVGASFISVEQARRNLDAEAPDGTALEDTAHATRKAWAEKLDRLEVGGATDAQLDVLYTAVFHALQYPYEQSENGSYYSGYDDAVHQGESYTGYSIWDTYRAAWALQILLAPERIPGMVQSMLQDYQQGGWLPMWKNIVETNIMVGTHADSLVAEALAKNIRGFNATLAFEAVRKDATVPPAGDANIVYSDRQENVGYEVRAGLSTMYAQKGFVANDIHSEAGSRTLDYAYDDYAVSVVAAHVNASADAAFFRNRSMTAPFSIYNTATGFLEARNADGAWAGEGEGWTEGDKWAYSFDVVHDVDGLIVARGGKSAFVASLDAHFDGGHNDHTNEPSHHIPYLYALADAASKGQERIRNISAVNYNNTENGLSGNEDCGQMSAWYVFSALGFYPVNPASAEYVVGTPFFDNVTLHLPGAARPLVISAPGASTQSYVRSLTLNGAPVRSPVLAHSDIAQGGELIFEMRDTPQEWASGTAFVNASGAAGSSGSSASTQTQTGSAGLAKQNIGIATALTTGFLLFIVSRLV